MRSATKSGFHVNIIIREHRRWIVEKYRLYEEEIDFIDTQLFKDNKNYHAWSYRIWLCKEFNLFDEEKENIDQFFIEDIKNNSAWNYRYFLFSQRFMKDESSQKEEISWTIERIKQKPDNEASWNYLSGWFPFYNFSCFGKQDQNKDEVKGNKFLKFEDFAEVEDFASKMMQNDCLFAISFIINLYLVEKRQVSPIMVLLDKLIEMDPIRSNYWNWNKQQLQKEVESNLYVPNSSIQKEKVQNSEEEEEKK